MQKSNDIHAESLSAVVAVDQRLFYVQNRFRDTLSYSGVLYFRLLYDDCANNLKLL